MTEVVYLIVSKECVWPQFLLFNEGKKSRGGEIKKKESKIRPKIMTAEITQHFSSKDSQRILKLVCYSLYVIPAKGSSQKWPTHHWRVQKYRSRGYLHFLRTGSAFLFCSGIILALLSNSYVLCCFVSFILQKLLDRDIVHCLAQ